MGCPEILSDGYECETKLIDYYVQKITNCPDDTQKLKTALTELVESKLKYDGCNDFAINLRRDRTDPNPAFVRTLCPYCKDLGSAHPHDQRCTCQKIKNEKPATPGGFVVGEFKKYDRFLGKFKKYDLQFGDLKCQECNGSGSRLGFMGFSILNCTVCKGSKCIGGECFLFFQ